MELRGSAGSELGLSIVGYQFPEETVDPWDSNALLVAVRVVSPHGRWEVVDPCLTTWEAAQLASWMTAVATAPDRAAPSVVAPNLSVSAVLNGPRILLTACFELEERPPWLVSVAGSDELCVELDVSSADLVVASGALRAGLAHFPQRGDDPTI
ncbi:MAG: WapI family immunity protein [Acidimicrobiales bacterium]